MSRMNTCTLSLSGEARALAASSMTYTRWSSSSSRSARDCAASRLSSTIIRLKGMIGIKSVLFCGAGCNASTTRLLSGSVTVKVLPQPTPSLSAFTWPPCSAVMFFTSESPSPKPPCARSGVRSPCVKRSKIKGSSAADMPLPLSLTKIRACSSSTSRASSMVPF